MDLYKEYAKKSTLLTDYQLCKAYFGVNESLRRIVYRILCLRYTLPWQQKLLRKLINSECKTYCCKQLNLDETNSSILKKFVEKNMSKMVGDMKNGHEYPVFLRDLVENVKKH